MSTRKTILVHGALVAGLLAVVGSLYAQIAGMWVASQTVPRPVTVGAAKEPDTRDLASTLAWRLPLTMAAIGFAIVAAGEGMKALWRKPAPLPTIEGLSEEDTQRILREIEMQETLAEMRREELAVGDLSLEPRAEATG